MNTTKIRERYRMYMEDMYGVRRVKAMKQIGSGQKAAQVYDG